MTNPTTPHEQWESWFQAVWSVREDVILPHLFGDIGKTIANIPAPVFESIGARDVDPRWTTTGVVTSPPQPKRPDWIYVTSGLSNPWGLDPAEADKRLPSGLGFELMVQTREAEAWPTNLLHWLSAIQILAASGLLQGELVRYGDLVPLRRSINPDTDSALRNLFIAPPDMEANRFQLDSGTVDLLLCVGITDEEHDFALKNGSSELLDLLKEKKAYPATDAGRRSLV